MQIVQVKMSGSLAQAEPTAPAKFARVIILNPPSPPGFVANRESHGGYGQLYPVGAPIPISMDFPYLVGHLDQKGVPFDVLESQGMDLSCRQVTDRISRIARGQGRTLTVVRVALCCLDWDLSVCEAIKRASPDVAVAIYGPIIPDILRRVQKESFLDYIVQGEPDDTVFELAGSKPEETISGLHARRGSEWLSNPSRPLANNLDALAFPKWELLPYQRYTIPRSSATATVPFLPMLTSRGCPFGCHYCPYPINQGLPFRYRSPTNVVDEIEHLVRDLGIEYIIFRDPMFSLRQDRVISICNEIGRRKISVRWKCETRVDCLNKETLVAMAVAGCSGINFGIESAEVEIQKKSGRKPITQQKIIETVSLCRRLGMKTFAFFIVGLPGDTVETILESIRFAIDLRPTWVQFNAASPLVGTKLRTWAIEKGLAAHDEYSYRTSHEATMGNENLTKGQIASLQRFATFFERYLVNRGGILKDQTRPGWLYGTLRSVADFVGYHSARTIFSVGQLFFRRFSRVAGALVHESQ